MDLVSILIPVFNTGKYLQECIDSVINQTYKNIEIILIDDASTDQKTIELLAQYKQKYPNIKLEINKENKGLSTSRNIAVNLATGKYITFLDSDDYIEKDYIETLVLAKNKTNADLVICNIANFRDSDPQRKIEFLYKYSLEPNRIYQNTEVFDKFRLLKDPLVAYGRLFELEQYKQSKNSFADGYIFEDTDWSVRLALNVKTIVVLNYQGYLRRLREGSILALAENNLKLIDQIIVVYHIYESIKNLENYQRDKQYFTNFYVDLCFSQIKHYETPEYRMTHIKTFFEYLKKMDLTMIPISNALRWKYNLLYRFYKIIKKDKDKKEYYKKKYQIQNIAFKYSISPDDYV